MMKSIILMTNYMFMLNIITMLIMLTPMSKIKLHPMILLILLISSTIIICVKMNLIFKSWIPFILFLTVIGGLMIIYMYITSLTNNEFFKMIMLNINNLIFKIMITSISLIYSFKKFNFIMWNPQDCWNFMKFFEKKNELEFSNIYNLNFIPMLTLMFYLYFSMICIMNICYKFSSPLRQLNMYE